MVGVLVLLPLLPLLMAPPELGYKRCGGAQGVEVYRRTGSPVIDLLAEGEVDAPAELIRDVLLDYEAATRTTKRVAESRVLMRSEREVWVYQRLDLPIVADRDYTQRVEWGTRGVQVFIRFVVDNERGPAERRGVVRVPTLNGGWELEPIRDGKATHVRYRIEIDLGGSIPRWMVSGGAAKDLPRMFEGLRRQVRMKQAGVDEAGR